MPRSIFELQRDLKALAHDLADLYSASYEEHFAVGIRMLDQLDGIRLELWQRIKDRRRTEAAWAQECKKAGWDPKAGQSAHTVDPGDAISGERDP